MRFLWCFLSLLLSPFFTNAAGQVGEFELQFVSPLSEDQRISLRSLVEVDEEAARRYEEIKARALGAIDRKPAALEVIEYEGLVHTDPRRVACVKQLERVNEVAALLSYWQVSADEKAAEACRRHITAWAVTYVPTGNDVNENKLIAIFCAYHALRESFDPVTRKVVDGWCGTIGELQASSTVASDHLTNRFTKRLRLLEILARTLGREDWAEIVQKGLKRFVTASLYKDGRSRDLLLRDTLTYHCSALKPLLDLGRFMGDDGVALYRWESPDGGSIKKSVDYVVPYANGSKTRKEWLNTKVELDRQRAAAGLEAYRPGRLFEPPQAYSMLLLASYFDPDLSPLVQSLSGQPASRFPNWQTVVLLASGRME